MATKLFNSKGINREVIVGRHTMILSLNPEMTVSFRLKGKKTRYTTTLHSCYNMAVLSHVQKEYNDKLKRYNEKKKLGYKGLKKPKAPNLGRVFDKTNFIALDNQK